MRIGWLLPGALALAACAHSRAPDAAQAAAPADWKRVITGADMKRLREWREAFVRALDAARASGNGAKIVREGALLAPDAGLPGPGLPSGRYRCRVIKLGAQGSGMLDYVTYPQFDCQVSNEGDVASFAKTSGSQRPVGLIFSGGAMGKDVFLGTLMLGDETAALEYGQDTARDMAGAIDRIGPKRWRLILPYPRFESMLDVIELVPAA